MKIGTKIRVAAFATMTFAALLISAVPGLRAQTATRYLGSITVINGDTLTVKTDQGDAHQVQVSTTAQLKRIAPGQTDLSKAETIDFSSLAMGDRVLVTLDPNATGGTPQAARIIAIKQADVTKLQQAETEEWAHGIHGLVKSIDSTSSAIVVNTRVGSVTKAVTVTIGKATTLKRYASGSVRFDQAQPAPISAIQPGDSVIFVRGNEGLLMAQQWLQTAWSQEVFAA